MKEHQFVGYSVAENDHEYSFKVWNFKDKQASMDLSVWGYNYLYWEGLTFNELPRKRNGGLSTERFFGLVSKSSFCVLELKETGFPKYIFILLLGRPVSFDPNTQKLTFRNQSKNHPVQFMVWVTEMSFFSQKRCFV